MTRPSTLIVAHEAVATVEAGQSSMRTRFDKDDEEDAPRAVEDEPLA